MDTTTAFLLAATRKAREHEEAPPEAETIDVSETVSKAASVYETIRNTLEFDEEHLLRRNAIRRIVKRRLGDAAADALALDLLRELIWARYLPNKHVSLSMVGVVTRILEKYAPLFEASSKRADAAFLEAWLLDVLSTEVEYVLSPPLVDEALASMAYQQFKSRVSWNDNAVAEADRDLQTYIAVHRAVLKSNLATLRFRVLTLFYPDWTTISADAPLVTEVAEGLDRVVSATERHITHPAADGLFQLVRRHAIVFHILRDYAAEHPEGLAEVVTKHNIHELETMVERLAHARYTRFHIRLRRSVVRAVIFLFLTKMMLALLIEVPYERFYLKSTALRPLLVNILFHPFLLGVIGLTVRIPGAKNTEKITEELGQILWGGEELVFPFRGRRRWTRGGMGTAFTVLYVGMFVVTISVIAGVLRHFEFNALSIVFFVFFLSLVTFFGLKIRNTRRELLVIETTPGLIGTLADMAFLPMIRAGRWVALRAPRINVFLFFFDFIVEAPFKAAISLVEGWLAFLREKKEEI